MWSKALLFIVVIYLPLFYEAFRITATGYQIVFYLCICGLVFAAIVSEKKRKDPSLLKTADAYIKFNILYLLIIGIQFLFYAEGISVTFYLAQGFILSLMLIFYLSRYDDAMIIDTLNTVFQFVALAFLIQFALSAYESHLGQYIFGDTGWIEQTYTMSNQELEDRIVLSAVTSTVGLSNYFLYPFSGLVGQHNYWGTQLPFYNLIFLGMFYKKRNIYTGTLVFLVLPAIVLNSSRFGIAAIVLTDLLFAYFLFKKGRIIVTVTLSIVFFYLLYNFNAFSGGWDEYFEKTDTLSPRITSYQLLYDRFFSFDIISMIFGLGPNKSGQVVVAITGFGSFESELLALAYTSGLIGLFIFVIFLLKQLTRNLHFHLYPKVVGVLIVLNIIGVSLTTNLVFVASVYPFVTLLYVYNLATETIAGRESKIFT